MKVKLQIHLLLFILFCACSAYAENSDDPASEHKQLTQKEQHIQQGQQDRQEHPDTIRAPYKTMKTIIHRHGQFKYPRYLRTSWSREQYFNREYSLLQDGDEEVPEDYFLEDEGDENSDDDNGYEDEENNED